MALVGSDRNPPVAHEFSQMGEPIMKKLLRLLETAEMLTISWGQRLWILKTGQSTKLKTPITSSNVRMQFSLGLKIWQTMSRVSVSVEIKRHAPTKGKK